MTSPDQAPMFIAVVSPFLGLSVLSGIIRAYTRVRVVKWFGPDDILIFLAVAAAIVEESGGILGMSLSTRNNLM